MSDSAQLVLTPSISRFARRALFWVVLFGIVLIIAVIGFAVTSVAAQSPPMAADNPAPAGAKALVEVLRHEGVTVTATGSLVETADALTDPGDTTIFVYDPSFFLIGEQFEVLLGLADTIVLLDPAFEALQVVSPDIAQAGYVDGDLDADCSVRAAEVAGTVTGDGVGYRLIGDLDAELCFGSGDKIFSLVQVERGSTTVTVLGATEALSNGTITENGNAALALNLLGENEKLIWYIPTGDDYDSASPTAAELSPDWVIPVSLLFFLVAIAAAFWRGRRLGPLIIENLPVTVRASETMQGRARLYEKANARLHTLDSLRIRTIDRLGQLCGLPALATVDEVVAAVAAITARDPHEVRRLLVDAEPSTDRELVRLSDDLLDLEHLVSERIRPE